MKFYISSGGLEEIVVAQNSQVAIKAALMRNNGILLSQTITISPTGFPGPEHNTEKDRHFHTAKILTALGFDKNDEDQYVDEDEDEEDDYPINEQYYS